MRLWASRRPVSERRGLTLLLTSETICPNVPKPRNKERRKEGKREAEQGNRDRKTKNQMGEEKKKSETVVKYF